MRRNIISIDRAAWEIVLSGVEVMDEKVVTPEEVRMLSLDSQVWVFITNHLTTEKYHVVKNIPTAKGVWDYLDKIEKVFHLRKMLVLTLSEANSIASSTTKEKR